jgi:hypothetical protein
MMSRFIDAQRLTDSAKAMRYVAILESAHRHGVLLLFGQVAGAPAPTVR